MTAPRDLSAVNMISTIQHNTIDKTAIATAEAALLTAYNGTHPTGGTIVTSTVTPAQFDVVLVWIIMQLYFNGTSSQTNYSKIKQNFTTLFTGAKDELWSLQNFVDVLKTNNVSPRDYLRAHAQKAFNYAKNSGLSTRIALKHGTDDKFAHAASDVASYITGMSTFERSAADSATQIALARAQGGAVRTNNANENTRGVIGSNPRTMMF